MRKGVNEVDVILRSLIEVHIARGIGRMRGNDWHDITFDQVQVRPHLVANCESTFAEAIIRC